MKEYNFRKKVHSDEIIATFDDVLILPDYTGFDPREISLASKVGNYIFYLPIMSAAMDTVTEEEMAIKMALHGGLGVLHRNCPYEKQLDMCRKVKELDPILSKMLQR